MKIVQFNRTMWSLISFEDVSFNKEEGIFTIYLFDGSIIEFSEVEEKVVFEFVIAENKENFYKNVLLPNYPYIQYMNQVSKLS